MRDSRLGIILVLGAAEVLILGMIVNSMGFGGPALAFGGSVHHTSFVAKPIAPMNLGGAPHVVINDPDSRVSVIASTDGQVHVKDNTEVHGFLFGSKQIPQLNVSRTGFNTVNISRQSDDSNDVFTLGCLHQAIEVAVPPQSQVQVMSSSGADIADLQSGIWARSVDGSIAVRKVQGPIDVASLDGRITIQDVSGPSVKAHTKDGRLILGDISTPLLDARTEDGRILADSLQVGGGKLETADGQIRIDVRNPDYTLAAHTFDGHIEYNGERQMRNDDDVATSMFRLGNATGALDVSTRDGNITITSNGAQ